MIAACRRLGCGASPRLCISDSLRLELYRSGQRPGGKPLSRLPRGLAEDGAASGAAVGGGGGGAARGLASAPFLRRCLSSIAVGEKTASRSPGNQNWEGGCP